MNQLMGEANGVDYPVSAEDIRALVRPDHVHRRAYADPEIFALEQSRIFTRASLKSPATSYAHGSRNTRCW